MVPVRCVVVAVSNDLKPDLLTLYLDATERQHAAMDLVEECAWRRSQVVKALSRDGMTQQQISAFLGLAQSSVWRLLHRLDDDEEDE